MTYSNVTRNYAFCKLKIWSETKSLHFSELSVPFYAHARVQFLFVDALIKPRYGNFVAMFREILSCSVVFVRLFIG